VDDGALHALAIRAAHGDQGAFGELRRECEPTVRRYVLNKVREPTLGVSVTDIVFDVAARAIATYPESGVPPRHWLLRMARWVVVRYYQFSVERGWR